MNTNTLDKKYIELSKKYTEKINTGSTLEKVWYILLLMFSVGSYKFIGRKVLNVITNKTFKKVAITCFIIAVFAAIGVKVYAYVDEFGERDLGRTKYYVEYEVQSGDTIWSIANDMVEINPEYKSIRSYASDIMVINDCGENITTGDMLKLPYYDTNEDQANIYMKYIMNLKD